jgi:penicillin-binding protein 1A
MFRALFITLLLLILLGAGATAGGLYVFHKFGRDMPDYHQLATYDPPVMTRIHAGDGQLLAEYAIERRVFVPLGALPPQTIQAFIAAEDQNFFQHSGIDLTGVARAIVINLKNIGKGRRLVGASTITQQVAKNFLLTNEVSWDRKIKEAILALRMEKAFTKERILELYLNEIYLGFQSYGVAAAALNYFDKSLDELSIAEIAYLAALPKAPNNYHPTKKREAAIARRDWVIGRMLEERFISPEQAARAKAEPLVVVAQRRETEFVHADYFAEKVRRELIGLYGEEKLYKGGLSVRSTLDPRLQEIADRTLRRGLERYDIRHGWRGPLGNAPDGMNHIAAINGFEPPAGMAHRRAAIVDSMDDKGVNLLFAGGQAGYLPLQEMTWARDWAEGEKLGGKISEPSSVLSVGDFIAVDLRIQAREIDGVAGELYPPHIYGLSQLPAVSGAVIALDPHTGRILAMSGGYDFGASEFNRATQAKRQPGSAFKPFVYLAALESGYTPSTLILDAPFVIDQGVGLPKWRPANYTKKFYGPSTMRLGIEKSRNLMTVRLAQAVGMEKIAEYAKRFGIVDVLPEQLSMALGAGETTLLRLTAAYAMLVNGGRKIEPSFIDRIQDRNGLTVFRHDVRECPGCDAAFWTGQRVPDLPDNREILAQPGTAYQVVSMLEGVVQRGTGRRIKALGKPLAGKTGTTNKQVDTWFVGFSPDLAVGVFVGFDQPRGLGYRETGSSVAAPIFKDFMEAALADEPGIPFRIPPNLRLVRINGSTGAPASPGDDNVILEAFLPGTAPSGESQLLAGDGYTPGYSGSGQTAGGGTPSTGTGGLY